MTDKRLAVPSPNYASVLMQKAQKDICALEGFISVQRLRYFSPEVMTDKHVFVLG